MTKTALILLAFLAIGLTTPKKKTVFIGTVSTESRYKDLLLGLQFEFRIDTIIIARNKILQGQSFKIEVISEKEMDVYYRGVGVIETFVGTIKPTDEDTILMNFKIPKNYKKHFGKAVCPKCNKHDLTIPIKYGLKTIVVNTENKPTHKIYKSYGKKEVYDGGCATSDFNPKYYCKRDKIKF